MALEQPNAASLGVPPKRWYKSDTLSGKLERRMLEKEIYSIGKAQEVHLRRPSCLDLEETARAYRTIDVMKFTADGLKKIHAYEQAKMIRFLVLSEMRNIAKEDVPDQVYLQPDILETVIQFQIGRKPLLTRDFLGLKIPPYFAYDLEFDGMTYHHAWDLSVHICDFELPEIKDPGRARSRV